MLAAALAASQIAFAASRAPSTYGDVYRVAPNGAVTNLTHDPAADVAPSASPNGKLVAFLRQRATTVQAYVVGSDGRGLRAVSPLLPGGGTRNGIAASLGWAPDSRRFAVSLGRGGGPSTLYLASTGGGWRAVDRGVGPRTPAWSADGRLVAATTTAGLVDVVDTARGRRVWRVAGTGDPAWSQGNLLAVHRNSTTIALYDARGRERAAFAGDAFAWSGHRLASLRNSVLELRPDGGRPTTRVPLGSARSDCDCAVVWTGANRVRARVGGDRWTGYDFARRRRLPAATPFSTVWSSTDVAAYERFGGPTRALVRGRSTVATTPSCGDDQAYPNLQFVGSTNALLYQSGCIAPSADVYTVAPDGTGLRRVTRTATDEVDPTLAPDGTRIAYSEQAYAAFCKGCAQNLWVTPGKQLTDHTDTEPAPFDEGPAFSPDGAQIAFTRSGPNAPPTLFVIPTAGGTARSLDATDVNGAIAWGPAGIAYVTGYAPAAIRVVDPLTHATRTIATEPKLDVTALTWSRDGRLAYLATDGHGRASITVGSKKIVLVQHRVTGLAWSPDGTRLAYVADDTNGYGEVWTIGADGTGVKQVTLNLGVVGTLSWR